MVFPAGLYKNVMTVKVGIHEGGVPIDWLYIVCVNVLYLEVPASYFQSSRSIRLL